MLDKETLLEIKDLIETYRDDNINKAFYYEDICVQCMHGDCKECAEPYQKEADRCLNIIEKIENYLYDLENP